MQYRSLGATGVQVSAQCLGTMMFGRIGNRDHDDCAAIVSRALEAGINFVDTADVYSRGESEEIVGQAIKGHRDEVVLATKVFNPMGKDRNQRGGSRRWIMRAAEDSLRRLGTDYIDLYQAHRHDWTADLDETLGALTDLVRQGKVRYLGSSSFPPRGSWRPSGPPNAASGSGSSVSSRSTPSSPGRWRPRSCQRHRMAVICWSPRPARRRACRRRGPAGPGHIGRHRLDCRAGHRRGRGRPPHRGSVAAAGIPQALCW